MKSAEGFWHYLNSESFAYNNLMEDLKKLTKRVFNN